MAPFEALYGRKCRTPRCGMKWENDPYFEEGDSVYLKVSPIRGTKRFQVRGKLAPRYVGPYKIEKSPISRNYRNRCVTYTTCSTYLNSKVPESTGPTSEHGCRRVTTRPSLSRETNQDFGHGHRKTRTTTTKICEFFGAVTAKRRQPGKEKMLSERTPPSVRKPTRSRGRDLF
ncbi:hypothetical protein U9M48_014976 [Paspalum notatum var. saurae]|uniref:Uncharacterized protein n=1 Tax=Paspalum notatum var. saurae TaxID=547442 RepID=A0AAQ3T291_PASNO